MGTQSYLEFPSELAPYKEGLKKQLTTIIDTKTGYEYLLATGICYYLTRPLTDSAAKRTVFNWVHQNMRVLYPYVGPILSDVGIVTPARQQLAKVLLDSILAWEANQ